MPLAGLGKKPSENCVSLHSLSVDNPTESDGVRVLASQCLLRVPYKMALRSASAPLKALFHTQKVRFDNHHWQEKNKVFAKSFASRPSFGLLTHLNHVISVTIQSYDMIAWLCRSSHS